ncbi:FecR domain-containing protein [Salisediminibacterium selenitireducens]|uniref:Fibronectin type III domain protein n=1 Tax=Bacillus selenitireducens (strain ATCC 700615 / DSM 15326 / MLS10) TaxID=439292 RepID=D6XYN6_BACIE|nr:FecR domain-containing protein [Salisediminibacterium selenitireducens]ADH98194.1 Fibronectin type III domain protein [[Bacillus] selenitireducens MLS10]
MKLKLLVIVALVFHSFFMFPVFPANPAEAAVSEPRARLSQVEGDVFVRRGGGLMEYDGFNGMGLFDGDEIRTGEDGSLTIAFDSGDDATLGYTTKVMVTAQEEGDGEQSTVKLWTGKIWSKVKRVMNIEDSYDVETPTTVMGVRGTLFYTLHDREETLSDVTVVDGQVDVGMNRLSDEEPDENLIGPLERQSQTGDDDDLNEGADPDFAEMTDSMEDPVVTAAVLDIIETARETDTDRDVEDDDLDGLFESLDESLRSFNLSDVLDQMLNRIEETGRSEAVSERVSQRNESLENMREETLQRTERTRERVTNSLDRLREQGLDENDINARVSEQRRQAEEFTASQDGTDEPVAAADTPPPPPAPTPAPTPPTPPVAPPPAPAPAPAPAPEEEDPAPTEPDDVAEPPEEETPENEESVDEIEEDEEEPEEEEELPLLGGNLEEYGGSSGFSFNQEGKAVNTIRFPALPVDSEEEAYRYELAVIDENGNDSIIEADITFDENGNVVMSFINDRFEPVLPMQEIGPVQIANMADVRSIETRAVRNGEITVLFRESVPSLPDTIWTFTSLITGEQEVRFLPENGENQYLFREGDEVTVLDGEAFISAPLTVSGASVYVLGNNNLISFDSINIIDFHEQNSNRDLTDLSFAKYMYPAEEIGLRADESEFYADYKIRVSVNDILYDDFAFNEDIIIDVEHPGDSYQIRLDILDHNDQVIIEGIYSDTLQTYEEMPIIPTPESVRPFLSFEYPGDVIAEIIIPFPEELTFLEEFILADHSGEQLVIHDDAIFREEDRSYRLTVNTDLQNKSIFGLGQYGKLSESGYDLSEFQWLNDPSFINREDITIFETSSSIRIDFTNVEFTSQLAGYEVLINGSYVDEKVLAETGQYIEITDLEPDTDYSLMIHALDDSNEIIVSHLVDEQVTTDIEIAVIENVETQAGSDVIEVSWSSLEAVNLLLYRVFLNGELYSSTEENEMMIEGLDSEESYVIRIEALDSNGRRIGFSEVVEETTESEEDLRVDFSIEEHNFYSSVISLTSNRENVRYEIEWDDTSGTYDQDEDGRLTFTGLIPGQTYSITVLAFIGEEEEPETFEFSFTTESFEENAPETAPEELTVTVDFDGEEDDLLARMIPSENAEIEQVKGYTAYLYEEGERVTAIAEDIETGEEAGIEWQTETGLLAELLEDRTGLTRFVDYRNYPELSIRVYASNEAGESGAYAEAGFASFVYENEPAGFGAFGAEASELGYAASWAPVLGASFYEIRDGESGEAVTGQTRSTELTSDVYGRSLVLVALDREGNVLEEEAFTSPVTLEPENEQGSFYEKRFDLSINYENVRYEIEWDDTSGTYDQDEDGRLTFTGLIPGQTYSITVLAFIGEEEEPETFELSFTTESFEENAPETAPEELTVTVDFDGEEDDLLARMIPSENAEIEQVKGYTAYLYEEGERVTAIAEDIETGEEAGIEWQTETGLLAELLEDRTGLTRFVDYRNYPELSIRVYASNEAGESGAYAEAGFASFVYENEPAGFGAFGAEASELGYAASWAPVLGASFYEIRDGESGEAVTGQTRSTELTSDVYGRSLVLVALDREGNVLEEEAFTSPVTLEPENEQGSFYEKRFDLSINYENVRYEIEWDDTSGTYDQDEDGRLTFTGLIPGQTYSITVLAFIGEEEEPETFEFSFTTESFEENAPETAPEELTVTVDFDGEEDDLLARMIPSENAEIEQVKGYTAYLYEEGERVTAIAEDIETGEEAGIEWQTGTGLLAELLEDRTGLTRFVDYRNYPELSIRVYASNEAGESGAYAEAGFASFVYENEPAGFGALSIDSFTGNVILEWEAVLGAVRYYVETPEGELIAESEERNLSIDYLVANTFYNNFRIIAEDRNGHIISDEKLEFETEEISINLIQYYKNGDYLYIEWAKIEDYQSEMDFKITVYDENENELTQIITSDNSVSIIDNALNIPGDHRITITVIDIEEDTVIGDESFSIDTNDPALIDPPVSLNGKLSDWGEVTEVEVQPDSLNIITKLKISELNLTGETDVVYALKGLAEGNIFTLAESDQQDGDKISFNWIYEQSTGILPPENGDFNFQEVQIGSPEPEMVFVTASTNQGEVVLFQEEMPRPPIVERVFESRINETRKIFISSAGDTDFYFMPERENPEVQAEDGTTKILLDEGKENVVFVKGQNGLLSLSSISGNVEHEWMIPFEFNQREPEIIELNTEELKVRLPEEVTALLEEQNEYTLEILINDKQYNDLNIIQSEIVLPIEDAAATQKIQMNVKKQDEVMIEGYFFEEIDIPHEESFGPSNLEVSFNFDSDPWTTSLSGEFDPSSNLNNLNWYELFAYDDNGERVLQEPLTIIEDDLSNPSFDFIIDSTSVEFGPEDTDSLRIYARTDEGLFQDFDEVMYESIQYPEISSFLTVTELDRSATLMWTALSDTHSYQLRDEENDETIEAFSGFESGTSYEYQISGLEPSTNYEKFHLYRFDASGKQIDSQPLSFTTDEPLNVPEIEGFNIIAGVSMIDLFWSDSDEIDSYNIYVNGVFVQRISDTMYSFEAEPGTSYSIRVDALDLNENVQSRSETESETDELEITVSKNPDLVTENSIELDIESNLSGGVSYTFRLLDSERNEIRVLEEQFSPFQIEGLEPGTDYILETNALIIEGGTGEATKEFAFSTAQSENQVNGNPDNLDLDGELIFEGSSEDQTNEQEEKVNNKLSEEHVSENPDAPVEKESSEGDEQVDAEDEVEGRTEDQDKESPEKNEEGGEEHE